MPRSHRKDRVTDHPEADAKKSARSAPPTLSQGDATEMRFSAVLKEISKLKAKDIELARRLDDLAAEVGVRTGLRN
jgi:hypothetical protein